MSSPKDRQREEIISFSAHYSHQAFNRLDEAPHPHWGGQSHPETTLQTCLEIMCNQISGHSMAQSSWHIKLAIPPSYLSSSGALSVYPLGSVSHFKPQPHGRHSTSNLLLNLIDSSITAFLISVPSFQVHWQHPMQTMTLGQLDCQGPLTPVFLPFSSSSSNTFFPSTRLPESPHWCHLLPARPIFHGHILVAISHFWLSLTYPHFQQNWTAYCLFSYLSPFSYLWTSAYIYVVPSSWNAFLLSVHSTPSPNSESASHFCS